MSPFRQLGLFAAWLMFIVGTCVALNATTGETLAQAPLAGGALPPEVAGSAAVSSSSQDGSQPPSTSTVTVSKFAPYRPGVPVHIDIPFASSNYADGVHADVTSDPLNPDGSIFVPDDPTTVSWANQDAAPGSNRGTVILTSHVNFVINGESVVGAFADLSQYARTSIGKIVTLTLEDGRKLKYRVVAGREYNKEQLAASPALRTELYNQVDAYGAVGKPKSSRLLLVSCGGAFDNATGEYEDNVFLYALPIGSA